MPTSSQKFIGRNRPPRVQIEYDLELYEAEKQVQIPFVMGVMANLEGNVPDDDPIPIDKRKFLEINADNFNERLKAIKPHLKFSAPNVLTGQGRLPVDLTFESLNDFSPAAIASKVEGVRELLKARTQLDDLLRSMDGKSGAEELISRMINDENLMQSLIAAPRSGSDAADEGSNDASSPK